MGQWDFCIQADEDTWQKFWLPTPPPGFHDVMALSKARRMSIQGNIYPFMSNLLYFKELLSTVRPREGNYMNASAIEIEPITGRYLRITFKGAPHRIYFEESGEGIPLLCLQDRKSTRLNSSH